MSAHAWKRRRAKAMLLDPAVQQWFQDCCDEIARELEKHRDAFVEYVPKLPWRLMLYGLPVAAPKEPKP